MRVILLLSTVALVLGLGSASSLARSVVRLDLSKPKPFFGYLHALCKNNQQQAWRDQLSKRKQARGPAYIKHHFKVWCEGILAVVKTHGGGDVARLEWELVPSHGKQLRMKLKRSPDRFGITVILEGKRLRIDEN